MENIILEAVTGSRAYGLNHANSDTDKMGIFIAPTVKVAGLDWNSSKESWSDAGPTGDDHSYHEVGKFLRLALKSNPTLIELLFMNDYEILTETGSLLVDNRPHILHTPGIQGAYYGYAKAQVERVGREYPNHKAKMARHAMRIARQGVSLLSKGGFNVKVDDPQEYFDLEKMEFDDMMDKLRAEVESIRSTPTVLPSEPNRKKIADLLETIRLQNLR